MSEMVNVSDREATQEALENSINLETFEQTGTLKELLEKDGYGPGNDDALWIHDDGCTMHVSHRYLCGGWEDKLESPAIRHARGTYEIVRNQD